MRLFLTVSLVFLTNISIAYAACTNPAGTEGKQVYNTTHKTMQFCDGTNWYSMKGGTGGAGGGVVNSANCQNGEIPAWDTTAGGLKCPEDTTPDAFSLTDLTAVAISTLSESSTVTVAGIDVPTTISVTGDGSPQIQINGGAWVTSGTIENGETFKVRLTSASSLGVDHTASITLGSVSDDWVVSTAPDCPAGCSASGANCLCAGTGSGACPAGVSWTCGVHGGWTAGTAQQCNIPTGYSYVSGSRKAYHHGSTPSCGYTLQGNFAFSFVISKD